MIFSEILQYSDCFHFHIVVPVYICLRIVGISRIVKNVCTVK